MGKREDAMKKKQELEKEELKTGKIIDDEEGDDGYEIPDAGDTGEDLKSPSGIAFSDFNDDEEEEDEKEKKLEEELEQIGTQEYDDGDDEIVKKEALIGKMEEILDNEPRAGYLFPEIKPAMMMFPVTVENMLKRLEDVYGQTFGVTLDKTIAMKKLEENNLPESLIKDFLDRLDAEDKLPFHMYVRLSYDDYSRDRKNPMNIVKKTKIVDRNKIFKEFGDIIPQLNITDDKRNEFQYIAEHDDANRQIILFVDAVSVLYALFGDHDVADPDSDDANKYLLTVGVLIADKKNLLKSEIQINKVRPIYVDEEEA